MGGRKVRPGWATYLCAVVEHARNSKSSNNIYGDVSVLKAESMGVTRRIRGWILLPLGHQNF